jgi:hypothetical protein
MTAPFPNDRRYARLETKSASRIPACSSHRAAVTDDRYFAALATAALQQEPRAISSRGAHRNPTFYSSVRSRRRCEAPTFAICE